MRDTDIRVLCPPRARPLHGHASPGTRSSGFSAGLVSLPAIHEPALDDSNDDADSKVDAHPPCPIQIGVCPQSPQTPDLGTPAPQMTFLGHTQNCAATGTAAVIPPHFQDANNSFLNRKEDPPHSSWASCSEPPAQMHNTNATADLSACNGTSTTLGQHDGCPDYDDTERTRPVSTPSVPLSYDLLMPPTTHHLHISVTISFSSGIRHRLFDNGRHPRSLWILSNIIAPNSS